MTGPPDAPCLPAGAGAFGLVLTQVLQNTVEDLLALGIASLAGYISVLGLPQKRAAAKEKLQTVASNFAKVCSISAHGMGVGILVAQVVAVQRFHQEVYASQRCNRSSRQTLQHASG